MNGQTTKKHESRASTKRRSRKGFTIFEFLVVMAVSMALVAAGLPAFLQWIKRAQILGFVRATQTRLQVARAEAIKGQYPVVVQPDFANEEILVFANVDNDPNFNFDPDTAQVFKTVDYEIARLNVPVQRQIRLWHPGDAGPNGATALIDLSTTSAAQNAVVFLPDGSVDEPGSIHIADNRGNFFSIRVEPQATGQVRILKYDSAPPWGTPWDDDGLYFFPRGRHPTDNVPMWRWF
jgi:type II secretory pathway pseudopilin PulG